MVPYFGKHGVKQYIHGKPITFEFKLWVMATQLGCCIQFHQSAGKNSILQEHENIGRGLGASVVANLVSKLPVMQTSNYHIATGNYFTSSALVRHVIAMGAAATGMVRANRMESVPFQDMVKMKWIIRCSY